MIASTSDRVREFWDAADRNPVGRGPPYAASTDIHKTCVRHRAPRSPLFPKHCRTSTAFVALRDRAVFPSGKSTPAAATQSHATSPHFAESVLFLIRPRP